MVRTFWFVDGFSTGTILGWFASVPSVVMGHGERAKGRSGALGLSKHIRDVFFSIYLDRPDLTSSSQHSPFPEKEGEESFDIFPLNGHC